MMNCRTDYTVIYARKAKKKKLWTPRYTINNLMDELDYYRPRTLILFAHGKGVEIHRDLVRLLLRDMGSAGGDRPSALRLSVPREGFGVLTLNSGYRSRKVGGQR